MDKDQIRKEFNQFVDSASEENLREFLQFMRSRKKDASKYKEEFFNNEAAKKKDI